MSDVLTENRSALRIAVDGASGAGKTTTARALAERLSQDVVSPDESDDGRTILFDWLEYSGGSHRGQPIRTQVIAVPGHLADRRRAIIELADVVLFVADSSPDGIDETAVALDELRAICAAMDPPPGIVVQANKRDAPGAHAADELRVLLELADDVPIVETVATAGDGVRQAFVFAVRTGLDRLDAPGGDRSDLTIDSLLERLDASAPAATDVAAVDGEAPAPVFETGDAENAPGADGAGLTIEDIEIEVVVDRAAPPPEPIAAGGRPPSFDHLPPPPVPGGPPEAEAAGNSWWRRRRGGRSEAGR